MIQPGSILDQAAGQLGGKVRIAPAAPATAVRQRGTLMQVSAPIQNMSVGFSVSIDAKIRSAVPAASNHLVQAEIQWGSPKGKGQAIVDVGGGLQVALTGTSVAVYIYMSSADGAVIVGPTYDIYGTIGGGSVSEASGLTFTAQQRSVAVGAQTAWVVPSWASKVEIVSNSNPNLAIPNTFLLSLQSDAALIGARVISQLGTVNEPVGIPGGCTAILLTNTGPVNPVLYTPVFHLGL